MCSTMLSQRLSNRKIIVDVFALMFGVGAWIGVNGIYVQLPLLVNKAPEGWNLPSYMVFVVQFANLGPILYSLYVKFLKWKGDHIIIYALLAGGAVSIHTLAWTYDKTTEVFGNSHSTVLLFLMFVASFVGCTSSVLFMPYMRNYKEIYLVSYLVGEGLSGFLPSIVALIQGVGGNPECIDGDAHYPDPRFSTKAFFIFLSLVLLFSFLSFIGLDKLSVAKEERVKLPSSAETLPTDMNAPPSYKTTTGWSMSNRTYMYLLILMGIICMLGNGLLPSIQSYSCLPYGNIAYHLTVTLASMAGPLAMCLGFIIKTPKVNLISNLMVLVLIISVILSYIALQSPKPPLQNSVFGEFLVVTLWILVSGLSGFIKMGITTIFRPDPGKGLYYTGIATQIGSLIGATVSFVLLNYTNLFKNYSPCSA